MSVIMMGGEGCVRDLEGLGGITGGIFPREKTAPLSLVASYYWYLSALNTWLSKYNI